MRTLINLCLVLSLSLLAVHEMDAMTHSEWQILPILDQFTKATGRDLFLLLHIPLFAALFWSLFFASWRNIAATIFAIALIAHAIAHYILSGHELYTFIPPTETILVYGAAFVATVQLGLTVWSKRT